LGLLDKEKQSKRRFKLAVCIRSSRYHFLKRSTVFATEEALANPKEEDPKAAPPVENAAVEGAAPKVPVPKSERVLESILEPLASSAALEWEKTKALSCGCCGKQDKARV